tara:strand:- start:1046 stop:1510 length:465 start_codon:yes stop_codon:yes gene_type:complete
MNLNNYALIKAATNIISGFSMVTLIVLGVAYMSFKNSFVFQDIHIEIANNPVTGDKDIEFAMIGSKRHECKSTRVYGTAYSEDNRAILLDRFSKQYVRNTTPGDAIPNSWSLQKPKELTPGIYRVSITGEFVCTYSIFKQEKIQSYDNILLIVK